MFDHMADELVGGDYLFFRNITEGEGNGGLRESGVDLMRAGLFQGGVIRVAGCNGKGVAPGGESGGNAEAGIFDDGAAIIFDSEQTRCLQIGVRRGFFPNVVVIVSHDDAETTSQPAIAEDFCDFPRWVIGDDGARDLHVFEMIQDFDDAWVYGKWGRQA